jgi:alkanesulfonate monooxygenase
MPRTGLAARGREGPKSATARSTRRSYGVSLQAANRDNADDEGFVEPNLWTGVGRARSGCGAALVGSVDQVLSKLERYRAMGIRAFILSGYPHKTECEISAPRCCRT